jgi:hypothetical protein
MKRPSHKSRVVLNQFHLSGNGYRELTSEWIPITEERTWNGERFCSLPNSFLLSERF